MERERELGFMSGEETDLFIENSGFRRPAEQGTAGGTWVGRF